MSSLAEEFFNRIKSGTPTPTDFLKGLIHTTPPTFESEWLDFKGQPRDGDLNGLWSKSLSAFANTEGGVLVWGIDAREDPNEKIDAANGLTLIHDTSQHRSRLLKLLPEATDPPLNGVQIEEYRDADTTKGFVVCFIPESDQKPIRAELAPNKPYYMRSGTSSKIIPRSFLRSLFFPQSRSRLVIGVEYSKVRITSTIEGYFKFMLRNEGPSTANDLVIRLKDDLNCQFDRCQCWHPNGAYITNSGVDVYDSYKDSLHPGMDIEVFNGHTPNIKNDIKFELTIYAKDRDAKTLAIAFPYNTLRSSHEELTIQA